MKYRTMSVLKIVAVAGAAIAFSAGAHAQCTINLTANQQVIDGYGFSSAWCGQLSIAKNNALYNTLGFSLLRIRIDPNRNWADETVNASNAHAAGAKVLGSPWSPPANMKDNNNVVHGSLLPSQYGNYAIHLRDAANTIGLDWVSIQNEPDWNPDYEGCVWTGATLLTFSRDNAPTIGKPVVMPECVGFRDDFSDPTLNDSTAVNNISIIAGHFYGNGNYVHQNALNHGKHVWETEHYLTGGQTNFNVCMQLAKEVSDAMNNQFSAYFWWWVNDSQTDGTCLVNSSGAIIKPGYILGQFAKWIRPGSTRITATYNPQSNVYVTAYQVNGGTVIVAINMGSGSVNQQFVINNGAVSGFEGYRTSASQSMADIGSFTVSGGSFTASLPGQSVTTFVYDSVPPAAPVNLTATTSVPLQIALSWNASPSAVSYNVKRATVSGGPYTTIASVPSATTYTDTGLADGTYYYVVSALNMAGESANSAEISATTTINVPSPWMTRDIGTVNLAGSAGYNTGNGEFAVAGSGDDIWNAADAFRYVYVTNSGDCTIIARVVSVQNIDPWSKAGVMIRESTNANAVNAFIAVTPGNGVSFQYRSTTGGGSANNNTTGLSAPYWVKLVRSGNVFTGYRSPDGANWTQLGTTTLTMASTAYVGLAVTAHNNSSLCTATFDNVSAPGWPPASNLPAAPTGLTATGGNLVVNLNWTQSTSPGIAGNNVYRSTTGNGGPYNLLASLAATTSYSDTAVSAGSTYYYVVTALNTNGESAQSTYRGVTTIPAAPTGVTATPGNNQVALSWTAGSGATSYNVKRATVNGGPYTTIASSASANYTDTTAVNGTTYYYVVSAVNGSGESANSTQVSATPSAGSAPSAPTGLAATSGRKKVINLTWNASSGATSYNVKRATISGGPYTTVATGVTTTSYANTGLTSGTTYYYVVSAVNAAGESPNSNQASATAK